MSWIDLEVIYCPKCDKMFNRRDCSNMSCPTCGRAFHLVVYPYCRKCGSTLAIDGISHPDKRGDGFWVRDTKILDKVPRFRCPTCNEIVPGAVMEAPSTVKERDEFLERMLGMPIQNQLRRGTAIKLPFTPTVLKMSMSPRELYDKLRENPDIEIADSSLGFDTIDLKIKCKEHGAKRARWLSIIDDDGTELPISFGTQPGNFLSRKPIPVDVVDLPTVKAAIKQARAETTIEMMKRLEIVFKVECEAEIRARKIDVNSKQDLIGAILDLFIEHVAREIGKKKVPSDLAQRGIGGFLS
jgi:hypothetical protein